MTMIMLNFEEIHINVRLSHPHKVLNLYKIKQDCSTYSSFQLSENTCFSSMFEKKRI